MIRKQCDFWIKPTPLLPQIFYLGSHLQLFSNAHPMTLECITNYNGTLRVNHIDIDLNEHSQRVYTLPCGCAILAGYFRLPVSLIHCKEPSLSLTGQHLLNVISFSHFFKTLLFDWQTLTHCSMSLSTMTYHNYL